MKRFFTSLVLLVSMVFCSVFQVAPVQATFDEQDFDKYFAVESAHFEIYFTVRFFQEFLDENLMHRSGRISTDDYPTIVRGLLEWSEEAYDQIIDDMGFALPFGGKTGRYRVILDPLEDGILGYAQVTETGTPYIVLDEDLNEDQMKTTFVHEFFHIVQFGYDEDFDLANSSKMAEGTAVWMEDQVYDEINGYSHYTDQSYFTIPETSVFGSFGQLDAPNSISRYGTFLWYQFLSERFDRDIVRRLWEEHYRITKEILYQNHFEDVKVTNPVYRAFQSNVAALDKHYQADLEEVFLEFARWNLDQQRYKEAANYPALEYVVRTSQYPFDSELTLIRDLPQLYGSNYLSFDVSSTDLPLVVDFTAHEHARYGLQLVPRKSGVLDFDAAVLEKVGYGDQLLLDMPTEDTEEVVLIVSVVDTDFDRLVEEGKDLFTEMTYTYGVKVSLSQPEPVPVLEPPTAPVEVQEVSRAVFFDQSSIAPEYRDAVLFLKDQRVVEGYPDGSFGPRNLLNRAEFLKIILEARGDFAFEGSSSCFPDVQSDQWFAPYVCYAKDTSIVGGFPDGSFGPGENITTAAAYKIVFERFFPGQMVETEGEWYQRYFRFAAQKGLEHRQELDPGQALTREEMAQLMYLILTLPPA